MANIKKPEDRKSVQINLRITQQEADILDNEVEIRQCSGRSEVIRRLIMECIDTED